MIQLYLAVRWLTTTTINAKSKNFTIAFIPFRDWLVAILPARDWPTAFVVIKGWFATIVFIRN